jgi:hypothetical protein
MPVSGARCEVSGEVETWDLTLDTWHAALSAPRRLSGDKTPWKLSPQLPGRRAEFPLRAQLTNNEDATFEVARASNRVTLFF